MGIGLATGAFLGGLSDGYDKANRRAIDEERLSWEREDQQEKRKSRTEREKTVADLDAATKEHDAATSALSGTSSEQQQNGIGTATLQQSIGQLNDARANGLLQTNAGLTDQGKQYVDQTTGAGQPPRQAISTPDAAAPQPATGAPSTSQQAISTGVQPQPTDEAGSASGQPQQMNRLNSPFTSGGEGLYKNQKEADDAYYNKLRQIYTHHYARTGDLDKLATLDDTINKMRDSRYEPMLKAGVAAIMQGDARGFDAINRAFSALGIPANYDASNATIKDGMVNGLVTTDHATGKQHTENVPLTSILQTATRFTPDRALEFVVGRQDKERTLAVEERKAKAEETKAGAYSSMAATNAAARRSNDEINNEAKTQRYFDNYFGAGKDFQVKGKEDQMLMTPEQRQEYQAKQDQYQLARQKSQLASSIISINPGMKPGEVTSVINMMQKRQDSRPDGRDSNGNYFIIVGGRRVVLPSQ